MKNNIIKIGFLFVVFIFSVSCEDFLEETNENPNDPTAVSSAALLGPAQLTMAYEYNANFSRFSGYFVQHVEGKARQQAGFNLYNFVGSNFDTDWVNLYVDVLENINIMVEQSSEVGSNHYVGVGNTVKAFTLMLMTDYWNSIPYTEAFGGVDNLQPAFDSQSSIYDEIHALLASARQSLAAGDGGLPLDGDLIYDNDVSAWIKATHAIDARAYLHQALLDNSNYTAALNSINQAFDSSADDFNFKFGTSATTAAPWYQFNRDRGDTGYSSTFVDALNDLNDPRVTIFGDDSTEYFDNPDAHLFFTIDQAVDLVSYTELMFAKAECLLQTGGSQPDISDAYFAGIESSFSSLGLDAEYSDYIAQAEVSPSTITLEDIMTQKWIALFSNPESYSDWRRTGIPSLTPNNGVAIPTRWLYPQTEIELNLNTPDALLTDRVDWDNN